MTLCCLFWFSWNPCLSYKLGSFINMHPPLLHPMRIICFPYSMSILSKTNVRKKPMAKGGQVFKYKRAPRIPAIPPDSSKSWQISQWDRPVSMHLTTGLLAIVAASLWAVNSKSRRLLRHLMTFPLTGTTYQVHPMKMCRPPLSLCPLLLRWLIPQHQSKQNWVRP